MGLAEQVKSHVVEPAVLRFFQWRGDPAARLMPPATKADPYPLYARVRQRGLVRSPLGVFAAADHATVAGILRDRRFSASPLHQRGYQPPSYPPGDPRAAAHTAARAPPRDPALDGPTRPPPAAPAGDRRVHPENHCRARAVDPRGYGTAAGGRAAGGP